MERITKTGVAAPRKEIIFNWELEEEVPVIRETAKAVLAKFQGVNLWFPKTQIEYDEEEILGIAEWLYTAKSIEAKQKKKELAEKKQREAESRREAENQEKLVQKIPDKTYYRD